MCFCACFRIHPRYKRQIAYRLALGAYQIAYGDNSEGRFQGPFPTAFDESDGTLTITYDDNTASLELREPENPEGHMAEYEVSEMKCGSRKFS